MIAYTFSSWVVLDVLLINWNSMIVYTFFHSGSIGCLVNKLEQYDSTYLFQLGSIGRLVNKWNSMVAYTFSSAICIYCV